MGKGRDFENRIRDKFEAMGYHVMRSAASKGIADLIAYKEGEMDRLIQCKNVRQKRLWKKEKLEFAEHCKKVNKVPIWAWNSHAPNRKNGKTIILDLREIGL